MNPDEMTPEQPRMSANTPTPRTDDLKRLYNQTTSELELEQWEQIAIKQHERLERELAAAVAECAKLKAELEQMREDAQQAGWERDLAE